MDAIPQVITQPIQPTLSATELSLMAGLNPQIQQNQNAGVYEQFIDNNELIDEIMHTFKGEIVDNITNQIEIYGEPIIEDEAINWFVGRILPYTSKIFSLSSLKEREVRTIIYEFEKDVIGDLTFPEKLGIDRDHRDMIKNVLVHAFVASIFKALDGTTMTKLLQQHHINETTIRQEQERRNLLGKLGGGGFKL